MKTRSTGPSGPAGSEHLPAIFAGIIAVEIAAMVTLYWLGVHFA